MMRFPCWSYNQPATAGSAKYITRQQRRRFPANRADTWFLIVAAMTSNLLLYTFKQCRWYNLQMRENLWLRFAAPKNTHVLDILQHILNGWRMKMLSFTVENPFIAQCPSDFAASIAINCRKLKNHLNDGRFIFVNQNFINLMFARVHTALFFQTVSIRSMTASKAAVLNNLT